MKTRASSAAPKSARRSSASGRLNVYSVAAPKAFGAGVSYKNLCSRSIANCVLLTLLFTAGTRVMAQEKTEGQTGKKTIGLVIHGGAGTIERSSMTPEREREYRAGLESALSAGYEIIKRGGSSVDAVEAVVRVLEDDPHFNAGRGSDFTNAG